MGLEVFVKNKGNVKDIKDFLKTDDKSDKSNDSPKTKQDISDKISEVEKAIKSVKDKKEYTESKEHFVFQNDDYNFASTFNDSYNVESTYSSSDFDSSVYYDSVNETSYSANFFEHKFLQEAQRYAQETKVSNETGKSQSNLDLFVDIKNRDIRMDMKTRSEMEWRLMYDGKLIFN